MRELLDLERFPLDRPGSDRGRELLARCQSELERHGMFSLPELVQPAAHRQCVDEVAPILERAAFTHAREHNIYFDDEITDIDPTHPALRRLRTVNHTICADQFPDSAITRIYEWQPLRDFLAATMGKPQLHPMADPLARINVMAYYEGEMLNWHFDRSEFTTTLLLRAPRAGGTFQYRRDLRSNSDQNYEGVGRLLTGHDPEIASHALTPGTLNVFRGKNTAHRVSAVEGDAPRIVAVFSYYETPGVSFSEADRLGFYGRTGA